MGLTELAGVESSSTRKHSRFSSLLEPFHLFFPSANDVAITQRAARCRIPRRLDHTNVPRPLRTLCRSERLSFRLILKPFQFRIDALDFLTAVRLGSSLTGYQRI